MTVGNVHVDHLQLVLANVYLQVTATFNVTQFTPMVSCLISHVDNHVLHVHVHCIHCTHHDD